MRRRRIGWLDIFWRLPLLAVLGGGLRWVGGPAHAAEPRPPSPLSPLTNPLPADVVGRIEQGEAAFRVQNYEKVVEILDRLAGHPLLETRPEHERVLEMLGASHWFMNAKDSARLVLGQLLRESPFHRLDEFVYPPELLDFFETRRQELITAGIIPAVPTDPQPPGRTLVREIHENDTPGIVFVAPFGVGQFVNDEPGKGAAFAVLQGVGVGGMVAATIGIETLKLTGSNDISEADRDAAELWDYVYYGGLILFGTTWAISIIDGFANRQTEPVIEERFELLEPGRDGVSLRVTPGLTGAGLQLTF